MAENINIAGRLHSTATGNIVAGANEIYDDIKGKKQSVVNQETDASLADRYTKAETYNKSELNNMITTPNQQYVTVTATDQTTAATDVLPATGAANTVYRVGNWDGSQFDASVYSEYAWNGSSYTFLCVKSQIGEVFDISVYNNNAKYANLAAALNGGANIPQSLQKGGMSVKFVQSSDNKYVQYRLMSTSFSVALSNWQGIDDEPKDGSYNLVKSGDVYKIGASVGLTTPQFRLGNPYASSGSTSISILASTNKMYFVVPSNGFKFTLKSEYALYSEFKKNADGTYTQHYDNKDCYILERGETMHICIRHTDDSDISVDENPFDLFIYGLDFHSYINRLINNDGLSVFKAQSTMAQGVYYVSGGAVHTASSTKNLRISFDRSVGFKLKDGYKLVTAIIKRANNVAEVVANSDTYSLSTGESLYLTFSKTDDTQDLPATEQIIDYWYYGKSAQIDINKQNIEAEALLRQSADKNINEFIGRTAIVPVFALGNPWAQAGSTSISILSSTTVMYTVFANSFKYKLKNDYKVYSLYKKSNGVYNQVYSNESHILINNGDTIHFAVSRVDGQAISISENPFEYIYIELKAEVEDIREKALHALDYISNIPADKVTFSQGSYYNNNGVIATTNLTTRQRILIEESCAFVLTPGIKVYTAYLLKTDSSIERLADTNCYTIQTGEKLYLSFSAIDDTQDILVNNIKPITVLYKKLSYEVFRNRKDIDNLGNVIGGLDTSVIKNKHYRKLYLSEATTPSLDGATYGSSWAVNDGVISHTGTDWTQFVLDGNYTNGKKYFITIEHNSYGNPIGAFDVAIGNGWFLDPYNGGDTVYCGLIGDGGALKFRARGAAFEILSISVQEVLEENDSDIYEELSFLVYDTLDKNSEETDITGFWNVAIGLSSQTFAHNINGTRNIVLGRQSMLNFQSGSRNVSIGTFALSELRRGECNVAIGADAMWKYQQAEHNIAIGRSSLSGEGIASNIVPLYNIAIGTNAIAFPASTTMNTIGIGFGANRYGSPDSVFIGHRAGLNAPLGNGGNVVIGSEADAKNGSSPVKNAIAIGKQVVADKDNQVKIGNSSVEEVIIGSKKIIFNLDGSVSWETVS